MLSYFIKTVSKTYYKALNLKDPFMYFWEPCTQRETSSDAETRDHRVSVKMQGFEVMKNSNLN